MQPGDGDRRLVRRGVGGGAAAAQQRPHARDELAHAERLGQVIVGAALEAVDLVGLLAARRQHQDRHVLQVRLAPDCAAHGDAVEPGQHHVEDDQIERLRPRLAAALRCRPPDEHGREPFEPEVEQDQLADVRIVFDDQHPALRRAGRGGRLLRGVSCGVIAHSLAASPPHENTAIVAVIILSSGSHGSVKNGAYSSSTMKRRTLALMVLIAAATIGVGAYYSHRGEPGATLTTDAATRGSIVSVVSATGTLQAVTTVEVGSQVSGIVEKLGADYNSLVHRGDVLATLEQSDYKSALEQAQAELVERAGGCRAAARRRVCGADRAGRARRSSRRGAAARARIWRPPRPTPARRRRGDRRRRQDRAGPGGGEDRRGEPGEDGDRVADRRRRDRAQHRRRTDRLRQLLGADAVRDRRGSVEDAGQRQHRRVGSWQRPGGSAGDVPRGRVSVGHVPRHRVAGAAQPDRRSRTS